MAIVWVGIIFLLLGLFDNGFSATLEETARKEGSVVVYGAGNVEDWQRLNAAFMKKYPFLKVNLFRGNWEKVRNRVMTEGRAGSHFVDVLHIDGINGWVLKEGGYLQAFKSAETEAFPEEFRDPTGMLPCCFDALTNVIGFNTRLVKKDEAPKSYRELLDSRWKDQLGMDADEGEWFAGLFTVWGREKTVDYFRSLMKQNPSLRRGHTLLATLTAAGEVSVGVNLFGYRVMEMREKGETIDLVKADPLMVRPAHLALARRAPHPNGGRLYIDFALSVEGQEIMASFGRTVVRPGVKRKYPQLTEGVKLHPIKPEMAKNYEEISRLFYSIVK
jgi:iron(III) transport system substrate-binding protein